MKKRFKLEAHYLHWGLTAFLVIVCSITFFLILSEWAVVSAIAQKLLGVLAPVISGLVFAYVFGKLLTLLEKRLIVRLLGRLTRKKPLPEKKARRAARVISLTLTMVIVLLFISGTLILILPQLYLSLSSLGNVLPGYFSTAVRWVTDVFESNPLLESAAANLVGNIGEQITNWVQASLLAQADQIISNLVGGVLGVIRTLANLLIGLIISIYVMYHKERFGAQSKKIIYGIFKTGFANNIVKATRFLDKTCGSFIIVKLIDSLIVGVVSYLFMIIFKMPYPMLISVLIGVTNIIPFFGPFIGGIPSVVLILLASPSQALVFAIFIIVLQQLDGNVLYPKLQGSSIGISGFWIISALLIFGGLFGFWGMLLSVPIFAVIYAFIKTLNHSRLKSLGLPVDTDEYKRIYLIDDETKKPIYREDVKNASNVNATETANSAAKAAEEPNDTPDNRH